MARRIVWSVYEGDATTLVGTLASDRGRTFLKDLSAEGGYSLESKLGHADEALLTDGRILRVSVDGTARWQGLVEKRNVIYADPSGRQAARVIPAQGRGVLGILDRAVVLPELGLGRISPIDRHFNPASFDYDVDPWIFVTALKRYDDADNSKPWYRAPKDFPDGEAWWIGVADGDTPPVQAGFYWVVTEFEIDAGFGGDHRFSLSADDGYTFYLDGGLVASEARAGLWGATRTYDIDLDEGTHRIAVRVENFDRRNPSTNATAFILSGAQLLAGGQVLGDVVVRTDDTWKLMAFPSVEPGMTAGKILHVLLTEAQANGFLLDLTWDFDAFVDSNGHFWPRTIDVAFPTLTTNLLEVVRHLVDEHVCDVEMAATGLVVHAYVRKGADLADTVTAAYGANVGRLAFEKGPPGPNVSYTRTPEGRAIERVRASAAAAWGRRAIGLSLGSAPSRDALDRQADAYFDDVSEPLEAITDMQLEEVSSIPLADFDVGDVITATASDGSTAQVRTHGIRCSEDNAGNPIWTPDFVKVSDLASGAVRLYEGLTIPATFPTWTAYTGRWTARVAAFTYPVDGDGDFDEFDFVIEDPHNSTRVFWFYIGSDVPIDPAAVIAGFIFDSDAPPAWADYFGVGRRARSAWDGTYPKPVLYDGAYEPFDVDMAAFTVDFFSDPDWFEEAP